MDPSLFQFRHPAALFAPKPFCGIVESANFGFAERDSQITGPTAKGINLIGIMRILRSMNPFRADSSRQYAIMAFAFLITTRPVLAQVSSSRPFQSSSQLRTSEEITQPLHGASENLAAVETES